MAERTQAEREAERQRLKALHPASPSMWGDPVALSLDPRRRAMQLAYPNSEIMWPAEFDPDREFARLEGELAAIAAAYPASVVQMGQSAIARAVSLVDENLALLDQQAAATPSTE